MLIQQVLRGDCGAPSSALSADENVLAAPFAYCWNKLGVPLFRSPKSHFLARCLSGKRNARKLGGSPTLSFLDNLVRKK